MMELTIPDLLQILGEKTAENYVLRARIGQLEEENTHLREAIEARDTSMREVPRAVEEEVDASA